MTDNLFTPTPEITAPQTPAIDPLLAQITDDTGKPKYASVEAALKALANAQAHIKTIESENSTLRDATTKARTLEEVLNAIKPSEVVPAPTVAAPTQPEQVDIASLVAQTVQGLEAKKLADANTATVVNKLKQVYGEAAGESFYTKAAELGLGRTEINLLAQRSPSAVFKLFGIEDKAPTNVPKGSLRTDAFLTPAPSTPARSGMAHGGTQQMLDSWRASAVKVNERLGINK